jgi:hypothetical protein
MDEQYVSYILILLIGLTLILIGWFLINKSTYLNDRCHDIDEIYTDMGKVSSLDPNDPEIKDMKLRDFYIKTAYNACALGDFKNTYVSTCALKQVIRQGVRCIDLEIYSLNGEPVIAVSSKNEYNFKQSYNYVKLHDALSLINDYAFSGSTCPNPNDPLIIHFRLKTSHTNTINKISDDILTTLENRLLSKDYSYEFAGKNLGNVPIKEFMAKVIICIDKSNSIFSKTSLDEYVNMTTGSMFCRVLRDYDVRNAPNMSELISYNKKNMSISFPDLGPNDANTAMGLHAKYGIQMIGMCYQNYDNNLEFYEEYFAEKGKAFVLKPANLRYVLVTIDKPPPQNPALSYANRPFKTDYYSFNI